MRITKSIGWLILGIITFHTAFSQENYLPGYIINNEGDTVRGFVDYRNWEKNPRKINFKKSIDDDPIACIPNSIKAFGVKDEIYASGIIDIEVSSVRTDKLEHDPKFNIEVDTVFLQSLIRGPKSLYYYKNKEGRENFYIHQDTGFSLLLYKRYLRLQDGINIILENRKYLSQLTLYLSDCETIGRTLKNTSYKRNSLMKLYKFYYECTGSKVEFEKKTEKAKLGIGILSGVSITSLTFRSESFDYLVKAGYKPSINYTTGIYLDLILSRNNRKWSIYNELLYTKYQVEGSYEEYEHENKYSTTTTALGYTYIRLNNSVRYKYPFRDWHIFMNVGMSNALAISERNYKKTESVFYTTERTKVGFALENPRRYEQAFNVGAGVQYRRLSLEIRYERGNGMSNIKTLTSLTEKYYLMIGYRFR